MISVPPVRVASSLGFRRQSAVETSGARELAFKLYLLFMVSWFLHLPARFPVLGQFRFDLLLVASIAGLIALSHTPGVKSIDSRTNRFIILLVGYVIVTLPFVQWPGSVIRFNLEELVKALVFYYFTARLTTTERKLSRLLFVFVICQGFRVLEPLYLHITEGYWGSAASMANWESMDRLSGAPSDVINPNGLAFVILTVIPFAHYLWARKLIGRLFYLALLPCLLYGLVLTGSRSGMVGLAITYLFIWIQSRRTLLFSVLAVTTVAMAVPRLSPDQLDRYASIFSSDTKNAGTVRGRIEGLKSDLSVAMRRPLFGHGLGTSFEANSNFVGGQHVSHNLVAQVLQELGFVGLLIFAMLLASIARSVRQAFQRLKLSATANPLLLSLGKALHVWFAMNLMFSLFSYGLSNYNWYFLAGLAGVMTSLAGGPSTVDSAVQAKPADVPRRHNGPSRELAGFGRAVHERGIHRLFQGRSV